MKKFLIVMLSFSFVLSQFLVGWNLNVPLAFASNWKDLPDTHMYAKQLGSLYDNGVIRGYSNGTVKPDQVMNRVEALKLVIQALNTALPKDSSLADIDFSDIGESDVDKWYFPYIVFATEYGYMSGYEDGTFRINSTMTRAEFLKVLMKAKRIKPKTGKDIFDDVSKDHWVKPYASYLYENDLLSSEFNDLKFKPDEPITRALASFFTYQLFYKPEADEPVVVKPVDTDTTNVDEGTPSDFDMILADKHFSEGAVSYYGASFTGRNTASGEKFDNEQYMTAHPYLPFGSVVKFTNKNNGNTVEARVVDCGPFVKGRVGDLSQAAFEKLGPLSAGVLPVTADLISMPEGKPFQERCYELRVARVGEE